MADPVLQGVKVSRRLAAIVSADVVGYSRLVEHDEEGTIRRLRAHWDDLVRPAVEEHGGRIVKLMGDGALMEFPSVLEAVRCALAVQRQAAGREAGVPDPLRIRYRIGIHLGDVVIDGDDIQGHGVNVASRLQSLAEAGGICISEAVRAALGKGLPLALADLGEQSVKNIAEPIRAWRVLDGEAPRRPATGSRPSRAAGWKIWSAILLGLVMLAALVAAYLQRDRLMPGPAAFAAAPSIAVLPFVNLSDDAAQEFFVDGLTEDLITDLSKLPGLFVISRNSAFTYKGKAVRARQVADDLGVKYVLNGSVRRSADRVRVNAQLIDAAADRQLWAERYDRELSDIFAVQDEVKRHIVDALALQLGPGERERLSAAPTDDIEAYDFYLRGRQA